MKLLKRSERAERWPGGQVKPFGVFLCQHCGSVVERPLYAGQIFRSCGCRKIPHGSGNPNFRHGAAYTRLYQVWAGMMNRCKNQTSKSWKWYGARGIRVCKKWRIAANFIAWAVAAGYRKGLLIDRKDNDLGYSPANCRWATPKESAANRRNISKGQK